MTTPMALLIAAIIIAGTMAIHLQYEGAKAGTRILRFMQDQTQTPRQVGYLSPGIFVPTNCSLWGQRAR
jgi:uncharacterized membrane protein SpoIIM required for sporulation